MFIGIIENPMAIFLDPFVRADDVNFRQGGRNKGERAMREVDVER